MKKIRVGIVGYGNLGMAVEEFCYKDNRFELVKIFSHRNIKAKYGIVENVKEIPLYKNKIDIVFLCLGSSSNLEIYNEYCLKYFCTINAYDNHNKIKSHIKKCDLLAKENNNVAFCAIGWDPGLFSLMRVLFNSFGETSYTSWGNGISQGHSEALRKIKGIDNAVQYTIPNKRIIKKLKCGQNVDNLKLLHVRKCIIVSNVNNTKNIKDKIFNMPNYFKGYKIKIKFVNKNKFNRYKKLYHKGEVFTLGNNYGFYLNTENNAKTTATIMVAYAIVLYKYLKNKYYGAYSILDIPISYLLKDSKNYI